MTMNRTDNPVIEALIEYIGNSENRSATPATENNCYSITLKRKIIMKSSKHKNNFMHEKGKSRG